MTGSTVYCTIYYTVYCKLYSIPHSAQYSILGVQRFSPLTRKAVHSTKSASEVINHKTVHNTSCAS